MKRIICLSLLLIVMLNCLASCGVRYIPVIGLDSVGEPYATVLSIPGKYLGGWTTLEFWIGESVTEDDFAGCAKDCRSVNGYLGKGYLLDKNDELPLHYVKYRYNNYPKIDSLGLGILDIEITDPQVMVYGLTTESSIEDFVDLFEKLGARFVTKKDNYALCWLGDVSFSLHLSTRSSPAEIRIGTDATGVVLID